MKDSQQTKKRLTEEPQQKRRKILSLKTSELERKQDEAKRKYFEEEHGRIFELLPVGITILDFKGIILYCNAAVYKKSGYSREDYIGRHFSKIDSLRAEDISNFKRIFNSITRGKIPEPFEAVYHRKDGTLGWTELNIGLFKAGRKRRVLVIQHDITERKKLDETLRDSDKKFLTAFLTSPDMVIITNAKDGKYTEVNDSFVNTTGYRREELIGHTVDDCNMWVNPDEQKKMTRLMQEQGKIRNEEFTFRMKSGEIRRWLCSAEHINIGGETCTIAVATDITELKRAEEALRESEEKFYKAFHSSPEAIAITTLEDGRFIEVNDSLRRITGFTRQELIGRSIILLDIWVNPEDRRRIVRILKEKGRVDNEEIQFRTKSGRIYIGLFSAELINIGGQQCLISSSTDITERKKMEEALRESEEKFLKAFRASPQAIAITTLKEGRFLEVNNSHRRVSGYTPQEIIGHTTDELKLWVNPEDRDRILQVLKEKGRFYNEELKLRKKSGEIQIVLFSAELINIGGEECIIASSTDITGRKRAEEALRESEEKFSKAFRSSPNSVAITTLEDGRFIEVNDSYLRLTGYTSEEVIGHTARELGSWVNPEDRARIVKRLKKNGRISSEEVSLRTKTSEICTTLFSAERININGEPRMISVATDITERKKAEEKLQTILKTALDGFLLIDLKGRLLEVNDSCCRMTGYTREELLKMSIPDLEALESPGEVAQHTKKIMSQGYDRFETQHKRKDGRTIDVEISVNYLNIEEGQMFVFVRDITERKRAEEALRESEEKFSKAFLSSPNVISITSLEDNRHVEINESFTRFTGYSREEVIGHSPKELNLWVKPTEKNSMMDVLEKEGRAYNHEFSSRHKSGEIRFGLGSAEVIKIGGKPHLIVVITDITERKRAEEALRESEGKFFKAFRSSPECITITRLSDNALLEVNDSFTRITGYTREEIIGRTPLELNIWEKPDDRERMLKLLKEKGRINNEEYGLRTKSGEIRTMLFSAERISLSHEPCLLTVAIDITEYRKFEQQAREAVNLKELDRLRAELLANISHELRTPLSSIKGFTTMLIDYESRLKRQEKREYLETIDKNTDRLVELIEQLLDMSRLEAGMLAIDKKPTIIPRLCQEVIDEVRIRSSTHKFTLDIPAGLPEVNVDARRIRQVLDNIIDNAVKYSETGTEVNLAVRPDGPGLLFTITDHGVGIPPNELPRVFDRMFHSPRKPGLTGAGLGLSICKGLVEAHGGRIWIESEEDKGTKCFFMLPLDSGEGG